MIKGGWGKAPPWFYVVSENTLHSVVAVVLTNYPTVRKYDGYEIRSSYV